jgi:hypothetical protein
MPIDTLDLDAELIATEKRLAELRQVKLTQNQSIGRSVLGRELFVMHEQLRDLAREEPLPDTHLDAGVKALHISAHEAWAAADEVIRQRPTGGSIYRPGQQSHGEYVQECQRFVAAQADYERRCREANATARAAWKAYEAAVKQVGQTLGEAHAARKKERETAAAELQDKIARAEAELARLV